MTGKTQQRVAHETYSWQDAIVVSRGSTVLLLSIVKENRR